MAAIRINDPLTAEQLRAILYYDPETGIFIWRPRADRPMARNTRYTATKAGGSAGNHYTIISIDKRRYVASRLAWLWVYGEWPTAFIDHINGNKLDDRIANLRLATKSQNHANIGVRSNNTSGLKGASWSKRYSRWVAQIQFHGQHYFLGYFGTPKEAHEAYCRAAARLHGEFAKFR